MKIFTGKIVSRIDDKTAKVTVERVVAHPVYKKRFKLTKKYLVHDEKGGKVGQTVRFSASKPYSRRVKWNIVEVVDKGKIGRRVKTRRSQK